MHRTITLSPAGRFFGLQQRVFRRLRAELQGYDEAEVEARIAARLRDKGQPEDDAKKWATSLMIQSLEFPRGAAASEACSHEQSEKDAEASQAQSAEAVPITDLLVEEVAADDGGQPAYQSRFVITHTGHRRQFPWLHRSGVHLTPGVDIDMAHCTFVDEVSKSDAHVYCIRCWRGAALPDFSDANTVAAIRSSEGSVDSEEERPSSDSDAGGDVAKAAPT